MDGKELKGQVLIIIELFLYRFRCRTKSFILTWKLLAHIYNHTETRYMVTNRIWRLKVMWRRRHTKKLGSSVWRLEFFGYLKLNDRVTDDVKHDALIKQLCHQPPGLY